MQENVNWKEFKTFFQRHTLPVTAFAELLYGNNYRYTMTANYNGVEVTTSLDTSTTDVDFLDFQANFKSTFDVYGEANE